MQGHGNIDVQILQQAVHHAYDHVIAAHVLARALGYAQDDGRLALLGGQQDGLGPLQVVDVELSYCIVAGLGLFQHFCCRY